MKFLVPLKLTLMNLTSKVIQLAHNMFKTLNFKTKLTLNLELDHLNQLD